MAIEFLNMTESLLSANPDFLLGRIRKTDKLPGLGVDYGGHGSRVRRHECERAVAGDLLPLDCDIARLAGLDNAVTASSDTSHHVASGLQDLDRDLEISEGADDEAVLSEGDVDLVRA